MPYGTLRFGDSPRVIPLILGREIFVTPRIIFP
jgi:hypothetical protein